MCYIQIVPVTPIPIRMEKDLLDLLTEGARRTPHKKQELIRLTLRRHLRKVIDDEAVRAPRKRITTIEPWPKGALAAAYKKVAPEDWDIVEHTAVESQGKPGPED